MGSSPFQGRSWEISSNRMLPHAYTSAALLMWPSASSSGGMWVTVPYVAVLITSPTSFLPQHYGLCFGISTEWSMSLLVQWGERRNGMQGSSGG